MPMPEIKVGAKGSIDIEVTKVWKDGEEVTIRIPQYPHPITLPAKAINWSTQEPVDHGPKPVKRPSYAGKSKLAKIMNEE
jgi:hypothetical protein